MIDTGHNPGNADAAEIGKFDAIAHRFWDPEGDFKPLHRLNPVRSAYIAANCRLPGSAVLDVGCGGGLLCESLAAQGASVTGIDLAPAMLESARLHAAERGLAIDYRQQEVAVLAGTRPGSFDVVTCMEMLEHVPDPAAVVAALALLARPGGQVFISTLSRSLRAFLGAIVAAEYLLRLVPRGTHEYQRLIRPSELARFGRAAGLRLVDVAGLSYDPFTHSASLGTDPAINYIAHFTRDALPGT
ncbi:MAG TPA: bifunctional 2-polyprenyl-6-hydroxyphenol methylase/3-demethylubiquinol 3-O-methyltransferase UbiG [Steroidobacteraceae bacterium]|nr:bifunctional 2-polyprenyl-6-hydroxyphenol methylase/3-demethylubiquinol 3-O-methyltransferase UbiG [Steroidobacteraceae bacterium]